LTIFRRNQASVAQSRCLYNWRKSAEVIFSPFVGCTNKEVDSNSIKTDGVYVGLDAGYQTKAWGLSGRIKGGTSDADSATPAFLSVSSQAAVACAASSGLTTLIVSA
jgi:hypothetical protein